MLWRSSSIVFLYVSLADSTGIFHLLYFKLTLARPVERDMTMPRAIREEAGVDFVEGDAGRSENTLRIAIRNQLKT